MSACEEFMQIHDQKKHPSHGVEGWLWPFVVVVVGDKLCFCFGLIGVKWRQEEHSHVQGSCDGLCPCWYIAHQCVIPSMVALGHYTCGQESPGRAWGLGSYSVPVWSRLTERRFEARAHPANMGSFGSQGWRSISIFNLKSRKRDWAECKDLGAADPWKLVSHQPESVFFHFVLLTVGQARTYKLVESF